MNKRFWIIPIIFLIINFNIKVKALANTYDYYPLGSNYIDSNNHLLIYNTTDVYIKTENPFLIKAGKTYTFFVTFYNDDYIDSYDFKFYDNNNNLIKEDVNYSYKYNNYGYLISISFITPNNAKRLALEIHPKNRHNMDAWIREEIDYFFVLAEGTTYPGSDYESVPYAGPMIDFEPVVEGVGLYITDINKPISIDEIKASLRAFDENDGDVTSSIIIYSDNYTLNKNKIGTYEVIFKANDTSLNYTYFKVLIKVVDQDPPKITGNFNIIANNNRKLTIQEIYNNIIVNDNYDKRSNILLEVVCDNYSNNYMKVGTYELVIKATDSSGNFTTQNIIIEVKDVLKPKITGPMVHVKSNKISMDLSEFISQYQAFDETDGDISSNIIVVTDNYTLNQYTKGSWNVVLSVKDSSGNEEVITITIEVIDEVGPVFYIDKTKIILDLNANPLSTYDIIDELKKSKMISEDKVIEIVLDEYSNNQNTPGVYKLVLGVDDERMEIEIEVLDKQKQEEMISKDLSFFEKIKMFFKSIYLNLKSFFHKLFKKDSHL